MPKLYLCPNSNVAARRRYKNPTVKPPSPRACASLLTASLLTAASAARAAPSDYFGIHVVDDDTGRGIPLVELRTTYKARHYTDSAGYVAFMEPGLADQEVWFDISSYGYDSPNGPFGTHGKAFKVKPGTIAELRLHRNQIAERLYRNTGYGRYRDTVLLGLPAPIKSPPLNGQVTGQDTVQTFVLGTKMYWLWQDTDRLAFALGNYSMTGATTALPDQLDPDKGLDFTYFTDKPGSFVRPFARIQREGSNPVWCDGFMVLKDAAGKEKVIGRYNAVDKSMAPVEGGLVLFNPDKQVFEGLKKFPNPKDQKLAPSGHPFRARDNGKEYWYISNPYPTVRVENTFESATDLTKYEGLTCLKPGTPYAKDKSTLNRDTAGKLLWTWQPGAQPLSPRQAEDLINAKLLKPEESPFQLRDADTGKPVRIAGGSVAYNPYLKRWTLLFGQSGGDSNLGEIWLATAASPEGPWRDARKVATHAGRDKNDLYNPMQHPELARGNGRFVYFEGTFVNTFSGNPSPTPYYDYNQLMYRLDLSDPRLKLPEPPLGLSNTTPSSLGPDK